MEQQPAGVDIFVLEMGVSPSYMLDDDDQPGEPTVVLDVRQHVGSVEDDRPIRIHLAASAVGELADVMKEMSLQSVMNAAAARREQGL